jgi:hypothetical protein
MAQFINFSGTLISEITEMPGIQSRKIIEDAKKMMEFPVRHCTTGMCDFPESIYKGVCWAYQISLDPLLVDDEP